jgi:hypothetical protein
VEYGERAHSASFLSFHQEEKSAFSGVECEKIGGAILMVGPIYEEIPGNGDLSRHIASE